MYNIAIIGAGQLGSRHLQGLAKIDIPINIQVVDLSEKSLEVAKERYKQIPENENVKSIAFFSSIDKLNSNLDIVIIATNSNVRYNIIKELSVKKNVKNLILEKVVFQTINHFKEIIEILKTKGVNTWVNCPRRTFPICYCQQLCVKYFSAIIFINGRLAATLPMGFDLQ